MKKNFLIFLLLTFAFDCNLFSDHNGNKFCRIVSLGPYITENLLLLGVNDEIVGVTIHEKIENKKGREIIGTLLEPNIEAIMKLKPDLVIASKEGNRKETVEKLQKLGVNVLVLEEVKTYRDLKDNLLTLAKITGKHKTAKELILEVDSKLEKQKRSSTSAKKKIFWQLGTKPLVTAGGKTYFNDVSIYAGAINIFGSTRAKYISVNIEDVIKRNPDIIIAMGMGEESYLVDFWKPFKNIKAVRDNKIFRVDDYEFCSPTPLSFLKSVETVSRFLEN